MEVGPGRGFLTGFLAEKARFVHAVELDPDVLPGLRHAIEGHRNVQVWEADAISFDYATLEPAPNKLVANLPYNVASPLVLKLLEEAPYLASLRFMVQFEVARRMAASKGGKEYGAYAVLVQLMAGVSVAHKVSPQVFDPPPRVYSAVVEMNRKESRLRPGEYQGVKKLTLAAFGSRRKRLANNLPEPGRMEAAHTLSSMGHGPNARAEELSPEDFVRLYRTLSWAL